MDDRCRSRSLHVEKEEKKTYLRLETYCVSSLVLMMVCGSRLMSSFSFPTRSLRTLSVSSHLIIVRKKKLTGCVSNLRVRLSWFPHTVNSCRHSHHSRSPQVVVSSSSREITFVSRLDWPRAGPGRPSPDFAGPGPHYI